MARDVEKGKGGGGKVTSGLHLILLLRSSEEEEESRTNHLQREKLNLSNEISSKAAILLRNCTKRNHVFNYSQCRLRERVCVCVSSLFPRV